MTTELVESPAPAPVTSFRPVSPAARRRAHGHVELRLRQSVAGFAAASRHTQDPALRADLSALEQRRREMLDTLAVLHFDDLMGLAARARHKVDIVGRIHRLWIRQLEPLADGALVDECIRGETALLKAMRRFASTASDAASNRFVAGRIPAVEADLDQLGSLRLRHDVPLLRTESH